ncbi:hypothetical protein AB0757_34925 [Scytonema millei VB511283_2]
MNQSLPWFPLEQTDAWFMHDRDGEHKYLQFQRGRHSQSIEPRLLTSVAVWQFLMMPSAA